MQRAILCRSNLLPTALPLSGAIVIASCGLPVAFNPGVPMVAGASNDSGDETIPLSQSNRRQSNEPAGIRQFS
jgi:hypothetical protein